MVKAVGKNYKINNENIRKDTRDDGFVRYFVSKAAK